VTGSQCLVPCSLMPRGTRECIKFGELLWQPTGCWPRAVWHTWPSRLALLLACASCSAGNGILKSCCLQAQQLAQSDLVSSLSGDRTKFEPSCC